MTCGGLFTEKMTKLLSMENIDGTISSLKETECTRNYLRYWHRWLFLYLHTLFLNVFLSEYKWSE